MAPCRLEDANCRTPYIIRQVAGVRAGVGAGRGAPFSRRVTMAKRGRPAIFDRDEAIDSALELFWERGYEGVTLEDLQKAMGGITPPSFYHAFGSKEALFKEVVERYLATVGARQLDALQEAPTARQGV